VQRELILDAQFLFLELGNHNVIGVRPALFVFDLPIQPGMFEFKGDCVLWFHPRFLLGLSTLELNHQLS